MLKRNNSELLTPDSFEKVISWTPLISIDLLLVNQANQVLLGKRINEPAKGYWFVPGGRILKDESIENAFLRISMNELGKEVDIKKAKFKGVYQHFYNNSFFSCDSNPVSTHYVTIAMSLEFNWNIEQLPITQHAKYKWISIPRLLEDDEVHKHTKWYFSEEFGLRHS